MTEKPEYLPFDQKKHLGLRPWDDDAVEEWEEGHGHDVRLKCYVEYGCRAVENEHEWLKEQIEREIERGQGNDALRERIATLEAERAEVEFQVYGGWDEDGPATDGLDGLDLPSKVNVLHSAAVEGTIRVYELNERVATLEDGIEQIATLVGRTGWRREITDTEGRVAAIADALLDTSHDPEDDRG